MTSAKSLSLGRAAFGKEKWKDAHTHLSNADHKALLQPADLELLAVSAYLTGDFNACIDAWTRAHNSFLETNDTAGAVRCAFWLGFILTNKGETVRGGGWIGHARKLSDESQIDCVEQGYLCLPVALRCLAAGDIHRSIDAFNQALETGNRFRDPDLLALAHLGRGQALIRSGEPQRGVAFLDEAMVAVESGGLSPIVVGIVYCAVIEACLEIFDLPRASEWTNALNDWCSSHPQLVPFRGQCLTRRCEIMRLHGAWSDAIEEAIHAIDLLLKPPTEPAAGAAFYQLADLYRLRGEYSKAEEAYREANKLGRNPQPGLALLRLAQGQLEKSTSSINNALTEARTLKNKCDSLFACIEIMLADKNTAKTRSALNELKEIAQRHEAPLIRALAAQAEGAVLLDEGDATSALAHLRSARKIWEELNVPYEAARTRTLMARMFSEMGDEDSARMEQEAARSIFQQLKAIPDISRIDEYSKLKISNPVKGLSRREKQVLELIADGKSNKFIANKLFISERTVERHVSNIFMKLDVSSRTEATAYAYKQRLL